MAEAMILIYFCMTDDRYPYLHYDFMTIKAFYRAAYGLGQAYTYFHQFDIPAFCTATDFIS